MELVACTYDDPLAVKLIAEVQQEYVLRYGSEDETPTDPAEFRAPLGHFVLGLLDGDPVACGGWRAHDSADPGFRDGDAEIKRMYVSSGYVEIPKFGYYRDSPASRCYGKELSGRV
ncbi:GNAT family N-acetyltransferase [Actinomadura sp. 6N118]|uniref:GNAT family N-acetyltransferase n=1 Tax=Actinomadura sp. 6N118 TaxID=3375151 RepID=UPI0037B22407